MVQKHWETAAEESGGAYLQISSDGSGAGEAIQAIVANCGGRSRPLDILPIDEFPKYFWWVDGHWEGNGHGGLQTQQFVL